MPYHKPALERYKGKKTRHTCPGCQKPQVFARYINPDTEEYFADHVGRCNREDNCGYHYSPKQYFEDNPDEGQEKRDQSPKPKPQAPVKPIGTIDPHFFKGSLNGYESNRFTIYLTSLLGPVIASQLIGRYFIGTSKYWDGATVFWQVDNTGRVRSGKIMLYNPATGRRSKDAGKYPTWVHTALRLEEFNLKQSLFGEHLLQVGKEKPVAIVESEKTAIIASAYLPQFTWLATGGKGGLSKEKCLVLQGRKVVLFPDLNAFDSWTSKAMELSGIADFSVSELLEKKATEEERAAGLDLADYLIRFDYQTFAGSPASDPERILEKEYYHHTFQEVAAAYGEDTAIAKAKYYLGLSKQYQHCRSYVIHNCALLQSYYQLQHKINAFLSAA